MILRTRRALSSAASPVSPLPALLLMTVRSLAPCAIKASISAAGWPATPKPPIMTVAPSRTSAIAASTVATVLSTMRDGYHGGPEEETRVGRSSAMRCDNRPQLLDVSDGVYDHALQHAHPGRDRRRGTGGAVALASAAPARDRLDRPRAAQPPGDRVHHPRR